MNNFVLKSMKNNSIENSIFDVTVNNEVFTRVDSILEADSGSEKVFELENFKDFSGVRLKFGNDVFGKKLNSGDVVVFKFIQTDGLSGNVYSKNSITYCRLCL